MKGEDIKDALILFVVITAAIVVAGIVSAKIGNHFESLEA